MKTLKIIKDVDIGSVLPEPENFWERKASRAVVFDGDGKIALLYSEKKDYYKLPGGGVEKGEDWETALRRELVEEIGCIVNNIEELGCIEEYRNDGGLRQISYCYIVCVIEKGIPQLDEVEIAEGYVTKWLDLDPAIDVLEKQDPRDHYSGKFMKMRDLTFLKEAKKVSKNFDIL